MFTCSQPSVTFILTTHFLPFQRARIGPGSKNTDSSSSNDISKFDANGNQDRVKLSDFNFVMVLGKGSFGKVIYNCNKYSPCYLELVSPANLDRNYNPM